MSEPRTEEIWVCRKCRKELNKRNYSGKVPAKCPKCGGKLVVKVVVLK